MGGEESATRTGWHEVAAGENQDEPGNAAVAGGNRYGAAVDLLAQVRRLRPVIHCITNYVTANDVANMVLAAGASPIMADGIREVEDIEQISQGLVLNLGTLKETAIDSMLLAGKTAAALGHPVVLDPVGVGASTFRRETALRILAEVPCAVIRGNASEIRALALGTAHSRGVDADGREALTEDNRQDTTVLMQELSRRTGAVIVMTGETDVVADGNRICLVKNGHPMMGQITGSGCMLDGIVAAFLAAGNMRQEAESAGEWMAGGVNEEACSTAQSCFQCVAYAVAAYGLCGELAYAKTAASGQGTGSFRVHLIDAMSLLTDEMIKRGMNIEV